METVYHPDDPRFYLKNEFEARLKRRPHYSLRAFARDLDLSPSTLSDYLKGKMGLSRERVYHLSKKLNLSGVQRDHWWDLLESKYARNSEVKKIASARAKGRSMESKNRLALEKFQMISEWQHFAIMELVEISPAYHCAESIAKALNISVKIVRESIERLEKLSMIQIKNGKWSVDSNASVFGGSDVTNKALREFHAQSLQKALEALETQPIAARESQTIIFGIADDKIAEMKIELHKIMISYIMKYAEVSQTKNAVYCLATHLFSLTNIKSTRSPK